MTQALAQSRGGSSSSGGGPFYVEETFFPVYVDKNDTTSIPDSPGVAMETGLGFDTHTTLGYLFLDNSFLFGLTYNYYTLSTRRNNVEGGDSGLKETTSDNKFGPTIGWVYGNFRTLATFFVSGTKEVHTKNFDSNGLTGDVTITNKGISGFQLDIGYTFPLFGGVMEIGPTLMYSSVTYKKQSKTNKLNASAAENYSGKSLFSPAKDTELQPMLTILGRF